MSEMRESELPQELEIEPRSRTVSFPDHYLIPYIEMCKRSKPITCGCSIILIGLAIFCFFATNYMINYPVTEARKIAFVFGGVFCLVAATSCLELRFRILRHCRDDPADNVMFEIARRDIEFSDSFSGHFEMHEMSFCHGTPKEEPSHSETPEDSSSLAQTTDDPCCAHIPTLRHNGHASLPRPSISDGMTADTPLLAQRTSLGLSRTSVIKIGTDSKRLRNSGTVSENNEYPPNYSTFENGCDSLETEPLLAESSFQNGSDTLETEPMLTKNC